jgi:hypothetical protein
VLPERPSWETLMGDPCTMTSSETFSAKVEC